MDINDIITKTINILKQEFPVLAGMELTPLTPLLSAGLLDSFAIVTTVAILEDELDIDIDVEKLEPEQFETATTIAGFCHELLQGGSNG